VNAVEQERLALGVKTQDLAERAARVMPGRQSNLRALSEPPVFIDRALGQRLWDVDGRELIDFAIGMGPGIWGHGNREYQDALHAQLEKLFVVASGMLQTEPEVQLAERIVGHVPCADRVRFVTTGSEAVQMVVRLARAFTGRRLFVRFEGHYHGWLDNVLGGRVNDEQGVDPYALENPADPMHTEGRAEFAMRESFKIPWNDADALENLLKTHGKDVALVLMEGVMTNGGCCIPRPGYLERVRELCTQYGVVFCIDEVITGFRMGLSGAQGHYGVTPDLASFGKAIAGGMPLAAVAGRADIFELLRTNAVVGAGTFNAAPMSMTAGLTTMCMLERDDGAAYRHIDKMQSHFMTEFKRLGSKHGHELLVQGVRGVFCAHFSSLAVAYSARDLAAHVDRDKARRLRLALIEEGVYAGRGDRYFVSAGLTAADLEDGLARIDRALARV
jgi:glutamate-1-semialdehyde 2,1-aminomutase